MDGDIERDEHCFLCGKANDRGLHLVFAYPAEGEAETSLVIPAYLQGWKDLTHGGFLSMLLDEAMAQACRGTEGSAVTGELRVRFIKPLPTGTAVKVVGKLVERRGRLLKTSGAVLEPSGAAVAEASATFLAIGPAS